MIPIVLTTGPDDALVGYSETLPFNVPPDVIMWGLRTFFLSVDARTESTAQSKHSGRVMYREAFVFALLDGAVRSSP